MATTIICHFDYLIISHFVVLFCGNMDWKLLVTKHTIQYKTHYPFGLHVVSLRLEFCVPCWMLATCRPSLIWEMRDEETVDTKPKNTSTDFCHHNCFMKFQCGGGGGGCGEWVRLLKLRSNAKSSLNFVARGGWGGGGRGGGLCCVCVLSYLFYYSCVRKTTMICELSSLERNDMRHDAFVFWLIVILLLSFVCHCKARANGMALHIVQPFAVQQKICKLYLFVLNRRHRQEHVVTFR